MTEARAARMLHIITHADPERAAAHVTISTQPRETIQFTTEGRDALGRLARRLVSLGLDAPFQVLHYPSGVGGSDHDRPRVHVALSGPSLAPHAKEGAEAPPSELQPVVSGD
jgi:hypothetical protein